VGLWGTRYLKDNDPEEYFVSQVRGPLHSIHHTIAEGAAGASLSKEKPSSRGKIPERRKEARLTGWFARGVLFQETAAPYGSQFDRQQKTPLDPADAEWGHAFARIELKVLETKLRAIASRESSR